MTFSAEKETALLESLAGCGSLIVAYSGGVDSCYLAWAAFQALGERALAIRAASPSYPQSHSEIAAHGAHQIGIAYRVVDTHEMQNPDYAANPVNRCYFCKTELFDVLEKLRQESGFEAVAYGINADDTRDFRPGHRAAEEHRVLAPLLEVGLSKREIRERARAAGLPSAELPASACLSSRVPYGDAITPAKLRQIDSAEQAVRALGYHQIRVRHHGALARVEIAQEELAHALDPEQARQLSAALHSAGFRWVSLDLDGYRSGSLNELLDPEKRNGS